MALPKKKTTRRTNTRRKTTGRTSSGSSISSLLALAAILGLGGVSIWAVSQKESPQEALANLWSNAETSSSTNIDNRKKPDNSRQKTAPAQPQNRPSNTSTNTAATTPVPAIKRPPANVAALNPQNNTSAQQSANAPQQRSVPLIEKILADNKPKNTDNTKKTVASPSSRPAQTSAGQSNTPKLPPAGRNMADAAPRPVFARVALRIHKNAWDKSPVQGTVKKGHEMRSYGQTGKWHRVVVPGTDVIGWVHENQLIVAKAPVNKPTAPANKNNSRSVSDIITGSTNVSKPQTSRPSGAPVPPAALSQQAAQ